jgi:hypothetical protein
MTLAETTGLLQPRVQVWRYRHLATMAIHLDGERRDFFQFPWGPFIAYSDSPELVGSLPYEMSILLFHGDSSVLHRTKMSL